MRLPLLLVLLTCGLPTALSAQTTDSSHHELRLSGYVDVYYANHSGDRGGPFTPYLSAGPRDNAFGLNVAQVGLHYRSERLRGQFVYQEGDIPRAAWSPALPNVQSANIGVRLAPALWLDAGLFPTHIGYESILPASKYLSSTAYLSFNEPFYQAGLKLSYAIHPKWQIDGWLVNGYNSFVDNNGAKSVGLTVAHSPGEAATIVYTNLIGDEAPEGADRSQWRFFHNVSWEQQWTDRLLTVLNADYGSQTNSSPDRPGKTADLYAAFLTAHYAFGDRWSLTGRAEFFDDPAGFVSGRVPATDPGRETGLRVTGLTLSGEYRPTESSYLRSAVRVGRQADEVALFTRDGVRVDERVEVLLTFGLEVDRLLRW